MPDYPPEAVGAAAAAMCELRNLDPRWAETLARAALDAAAPLLADACAKAILQHMETHGTKMDGVRRHVYRMHFSTAARVAASAFTSHDELRQMAARALATGNYIACKLPEDGES